MPQSKLGVTEKVTATLPPGEGGWKTESLDKLACPKKQVVVRQSKLVEASRKKGRAGESFGSRLPGMGFRQLPGLGLGRIGPERRIAESI
ncbi:hypothetical protein CDL15_Pgr021528 [Punica granatum]|uniref:Uncharacterized protein n=1 Tax=Punica granatum TaxID=22663 RepID=A0A218XPM4_PUNGR|nr:hypothetical protein CDL15_Pgr021528 [Punica granatum]